MATIIIMNELTWLHTKLNTFADSITATLDVAMKNKDSSLSKRMAALHCFNTAVKYTDNSMKEIEEKIESLSRVKTEMRKEEIVFFDSLITLKDEIKKLIQKYKEEL